MSWDPDFLSIEKLLKRWLESDVVLAEDQGHLLVTAELPSRFEDDPDLDMLPVAVVDRISGADLSRSALLDRPVVDVDVYGRDRNEAQTVAEQVRSSIVRRLPGSKVTIPGEGAAVFGRIRTVVGPRNLPHNNPAVRRYNASYEILLHRQP